MVAVSLSDRQKTALRPFVKAARKLDTDRMLATSAHMKPGAYFEPMEWLALLYAFDGLVPIDVI